MAVLVSVGAFLSTGFLVQAATGLSGHPTAGGQQQGMITFETGQLRLGFDGNHGGLQCIANRAAGDECLKEVQAGHMPFRIFADLTKEFEIGVNNIFQLVFDDPATVARTIVEPACCRLKNVIRENGLLLQYEGPGLDMELRIRPGDRPTATDWSLRIRNTGDAPREFLACFPYLDGVRLGPNPATNLATAMDQAGIVVPAWERAGGVLGESNQMSMQWHAIWDPETQSALALIFMDPEARPKRMVLAQPAIALHYFPPIRLAPHASCELPPVRVMVYQGDWRPAARAYRAWHDEAFPHAPLPAWLRESNGHMGIHFRKARPDVTPSYVGQVVLDSFRELPFAHLQTPVDNWEYAFFCRTSMLTQDAPFTPHTDGENFIREDLGGAEAMREGIAGVHRLGMHVTLYVEGYIIPQECDLAKAGKGREWAVMHKDGSITGSYSRQGFYHLCPGCVEWQDHLAGMVARLLRETGADAVRLDSLGFYYLPCYNPAHKHETPFGYNDWIKTLLAKVRQAAIAVNPEVALLTEGSADWFCPWFHGALTSRCPRDLSMMRLAVSSLRPYVYASGALWGSLSGFPGGGCVGSDVHSPDWNWLCARFPAHEALVWGEVADDDPQCSDPEIVARRFEGDGYWAIVAARPASQEALWPRGAGISEKHQEYTLSVPHLASQVSDAVICDIETLTWAPLEVQRQDNALRMSLRTNWALMILRKPDGPQPVDFAPPPTLAKGKSVSLSVGLVNPGKDPHAAVSVSAPGLVVSPDEVRLPGSMTISVPNDALAGNYAVSISGKKLLGTKRFLIVQ